MSKSAMPVSKAKTAYGLLSEIRKLILEEPKRYDQTWWSRTGDRARSYYEGQVPACGTVACVAGWVCALKAPKALTDMNEEEVATEILFGRDFSRSCELFDGHAAGMRLGSDRGIRAHAERGAAHIARFQKKYAKQLKAKRV